MIVGIVVVLSEGSNRGRNRYCHLASLAPSALAISSASNSVIDCIGVSPRRGLHIMVYLFNKTRLPLFGRLTFLPLYDYFWVFVVLLFNEYTLLW